MIIPVQMLMCGKEANNQKQEIDCQHHTIPNQRKQRPKDKHCGNICWQKKYLRAHAY